MSKLHNEVLDDLIVLPEVKKLRVWNFIKSLFNERDNLALEEIEAIEGYMAGDPKYTETISFEEASKKWLADD